MASSAVTSAGDLAGPTNCSWPDLETVFNSSTLAYNKVNKANVIQMRYHFSPVSFDIAINQMPHRGLELVHVECIATVRAHGNSDRKGVLNFAPILTGLKVIDETESDVRIDRGERTISVGVEKYEIVDESDRSIFTMMFFDMPESIGVTAQIDSLLFKTDHGRMQLASLGSDTPRVIARQCFRPLFD